MNKDDRRVRKTRRALQEALAELMAEKELRRITVQEVADRADVHRATFYAHYQDVFQLYEAIENQVIAKMAEVISEEPSHEYDHIYRLVIDYLLENPAMGRLIFGRNGSGSFRRRLSAVMEERYMAVWLYEEPDTQITTEMRYLTAYHVNGCISIIERWVRGGYAESGEEIYHLLRLVNLGFDQAEE